MRAYNDALGHHRGELIGDGVGSVGALATEADEVTLKDGGDTWEILPAGCEDAEQVLVVTVKVDNITKGVADLDLDLIEHALGAHEELAVLGVGAPHNSRSAVHLDRQIVELTVEPV